jgi:hypothetical protein
MLGLIALWAFWYFLWKPQRVDIFRQKLFVLREDLFDLAASGKVPFDHPAYTELRLLINGLIRFAHRASLPTLILAMAKSNETPSGALSAWKKNVQRLPEEERNQILAVHSAVSEAFAKQVIWGSFLLSAFVFLRVSFAGGKAVFLLLSGKKGIQNFTVSRARIKVEKETSQVTKSGADAIEDRVLREEQRRTNVKMQHVYAH